MDNQPKLTDSSLVISSSAFSHNQPIPAQYTCKGQNINPPLAITGLPSKAKTLALIMHDPDAVSGDFVHWLIWDIPTATSSINANSVPVGAIQGQNSAGRSSYMGPCPPAGTGTHRYMFELYALDGALNLPSGSDRSNVESAIQGHIIAKTSLIGLFSAE